MRKVDAGVFALLLVCNERRNTLVSCLTLIVFRTSIVAYLVQCTKAFVKVYWHSVTLL